MLDTDTIGMDWVIEEADALTEEIVHVTPSEYSESIRYLPASVTPLPGYLRYDVNPFMKEIIDCFDVNSPVRHVALKKGVQITWTTLLESGILYYMGHVKTLPLMYATADKELASIRIENNFIPMLQQSGLADIIQSSDEGNQRKTGKNEKQIQFEGGGFLIPLGAQNANKLRQTSVAVLVKDEIDAWPLVIGKDGDPSKLINDRCSGYWETRKIFEGSTPLLEETSKIEKSFLLGDQRVYLVLCKKCNYPQQLRWSTTDKETGLVGGFQWDEDDGVLIKESVRYCCQKCGEPHYEYDKERLFSPNHGAHWKPTARSSDPDYRSYHLPAMYSPIGMQPWYKCVNDYREAFDVEAGKVKDIGKYQVFYNNILAEPFKTMGARVSFVSVSAHRRPVYKRGEIPNEYAKKYSGSPILFLTCTVDVHKNNLAVAVMGWTKDACCYLIDYDRYEVEDGDDDCTELGCRVWGRLQKLIDEKEYTADDGKKYRVWTTLIDSRYATDTVNTFSQQWVGGVYPIMGRDRPAKVQKISEFAEFKTQAGTVGYGITVDHYKDRIAPVLRREWIEDYGTQDPYHFNAPVDITDTQLKELTKETRREKLDPNNNVSYYWHRPSGAKNELWDLLVYGHAAVEILAWALCIQHFELETIDWAMFWEYIENEKLYFS